MADVPGLTRDRRYGRMEFDGGTATLIDTGGLFGDDVLSDALTQQTRLAVNEADIVLLMFDGRDGVTAADEDVVDYLRKSNVAFVPVINKIDGLPEHEITAEFGRFGFDEFLLVSASHSRGLKQLREHLLQLLEQYKNLNTMFFLLLRRLSLLDIRSILHCLCKGHLC